MINIRVKMKEEEIRYLFCLFDHHNEILFEEFIQYHFDIEESKCSTAFSSEMITFLETNLRNNPVTTSSVLWYFQKYMNNKENLISIQDLYLNVIENELSNDCNIDKLVCLLTLFKIDEESLPKFYNKILKVVCSDEFKQHRKQILMSLMPQQRTELLRETAEVMKATEVQKQYKLKPEYMLELCYQESTHWLLKAAQVYKVQLHDLKTVTFNINNFTKQILILVLIDLTNSPETYDLPTLVNQLTNIYTILDTYITTDEQLQYYMTEVKRELTLVKFCLENNCKIMTTSVFSQILSQSALAIISQLCRLSKVDRYKVSKLLNNNNETLNELNNIARAKKFNTSEKQCINWDILTYNSYCAITKIIDTIMTCDTSGEVQDITPALEETKRLVLSIQPVQNSLELIENLFSCLFLRYEYFACEEHTQDAPCGAQSDCSYFYSKKQNKSVSSYKSTNTGFMCNSLNTQVILTTLKLCLESKSLEDKIKNESSESSTMIKYKHLVKVVNHALWKLQLVSTLSPKASPFQLKLCLDYVEVDESSDDEDQEIEIRAPRKKLKCKKRQNKTKEDHPMVSSTVSANSDGYVTSQESSIDFISLMLAKPNCLLALALYHNDFPKANQIIEMFDLGDTEIATEVTFTEQLRNLVAKIKNIIYFKDNTRYSAKELSKLSVVSTEVMGLVEGFLASNRAPNSFDIIELASRHPHLQLYSHQNAPFINAVDILLSSGLNREITYGLINVVERKLAEVRSFTDVAAVKKINYIRFVEDIASVVFEIFGNTDKAFDFAENVCELITDCKIPIKHKEFCKLNQLSKELRKACEDLDDIVNKKDAEMDSNIIAKYHQIYMNVVAASDKDICNIGEVSHQGNKKTRVHYLRMCYMYCKTVSQLEQSDNQSNDSSADPPYFTVLEKHLHDVFGNMIKNHSPVTSLEPICRKLNVNLIPKLILNFCPPIPLSNTDKEATETNFNNLLQAIYDYKNTEENLFVDHVANFAPLLKSPDPHCLTYILLHNWVLAHILEKLHTSPKENSLQKSIDARTKYINNYMDLERFNYLKVLFDNNKYLASLHTTIDLDELFLYIIKLVENGKISKCLHIIDALSEKQLLRSSNLVNLRDLLMFKLSTNSRINNNWKHCEHILCADLKVDLILNNLCNWPVEGAMEVLQYLKYLLRVDPDEGIYYQCIDWLAKIPLYDQIASIISSNHWYVVYEKSMEAPGEIIEILLDSQQFKLCLDWADAHDVTDNMKNLIIVNLLRQLFEYTNETTPQQINELLSRLTITQAVDLVLEEMSKIRNVEILQACVDFISERSCNYKAYENIKIGLQIMLDIESNLRPLFWDLIEKPLLMIEQFLMNAKLPELVNIINKIGPNLKTDQAGDNLYYNIKCIEGLIISRNAVDALLRHYAEKALNMTIQRNVYVQPPKQSDDLLESIDSINIEASSRPFVMPEQVPTKEQWVQDYSTDKCMLCHSSIFSMIIRRHHCRRCGRLICHACSRNRMQVPTYPSGVKFRVCDDCYVQTMNKKPNARSDHVMLTSSSDSAGSGATCMDWCLSTNPKKNEAVRTEFSYEFVPNVTLCLSIMKMHSVNLDSPRFLLDRSEEIAREVSKSTGDARMLLRARRSLLLAAAELYSRAPQEQNGNSESKLSHSRVAEAGALHATRCLAHADAMSTLVLHGAQHLMPEQGIHPSHIVRSLLEAEKWELALEIATKSGLSRTSVLAAWGKACLKAGCFKQARDKFALCFKNAPQVFTEYTEDFEYGSEAAEVPLSNKRVQSLRYSERSNSMSSLQSDGRPRTNPPLLNEIISVLEDMNYPVNQQLLAKAENIKSTNEKLTAMNTTKKKINVTEPALNIMHTLASVRKIKQGDYSDFQTATIQPKKSLAQGLLRRNNNPVEPKTDYTIKKMDQFFYKECVYYLINYGSHVANVAFYMKHSNLTAVLNYCNENLVDKETFTEAVYMECLKKDKVNELIKCMGEMDPTLEMWGDYITHTCRTLERANRLDPLYALQTASGQHARAAATCARLYVRPPTTYTVLRTRQDRLGAALHHLSSCVTVKSNEKSFHLYVDKATIDKHITTITRQIELAKYLAECEAQNRFSEKMYNEVIPLPVDESKSKDIRPLTLFGSNTDRIKLVAIVLVAGQTVETGFNLAFRIITENKLDSMNIYTHVARYLVNADRFIEVKTLAKCIRASKETAASLMADQVLETGVNTVVARCEAKGQLHDEQAEVLISNIYSTSIKISCYLVCRILSSAYILAAKHDRTNDLRRVLQEAERLGNDQIRNACLKRLTSKRVP